MPASSPILGIPIPLDSDARGAGADAIRDIVAFIEPYLVPSYIAVAASGPQAVPAATTALTFDVTQYAGHGWGSDGSSSFTYTGPTRIFHLAATVIVVDTEADELTEFSASILVNGQLVADSYYAANVIPNASNAEGNGGTTLTPHTVRPLSSGDVVSVVAKSRDGVNVASPGRAFTAAALTGPA